MTNLERNEAREEFKDTPQPIEGAIGAIDCTFINILAPKVAPRRSVCIPSWESLKQFVEMF